MRRSPVKSLIGFDQLSHRVQYCPDTGILTWKHVDPITKMDKRHNSLLAGKQINVISKDGYINFRVQIDGVKLYTLAHQVAYLLMKNEWLADGLEIDHINNNRADNRWSNLRFVPRILNGRNRTMSALNTSGYKGVYPHQKTKGKWQALITVNYKTIYLGEFFSPIEAAKAYDEAATIYHGEFAKTNFQLGAIE